ncbi:uncharacterized protein KIAA1257 homolog isoform X4 [Tyto alba]|uniref:uncharacterized protein KIAA1257 homolog isoform X4 n=1 Tax=Tyto alba TaxID=56313 RepID=UPI001C66CD43|nr:uncharacterized protein KIAA1257 homolog isoform X4 [Tyto alba]
MAEHKQNSKAVEEEEVEEHDKEMTDLNTICSESSFETENLEVLGSGGCLTPEGESSRLLPSEESSVEPDGSHTVTCTLTVSLAVPALPTGQNREKSNPPGTQGKRIQVEELGSIPRMRRCYHIEYFLLPDDLVPRKLDLVLFGVVAKLFTESSSEAITPWFENDKMWISWNHSVVVDVTNEYVIKLRDHKIILKIWDTKDKVSSKVGRGKPKPTSSLEGDTEDVGGVKHTVLLQRKFFEESQPAPSRTRIKAVKKPKAQEKSSALPAEAEETDLNELATSNSGLTHPSRRDDLSTVRNVKFAKSSFLDKAQHLKQKAVAVSPVSSTSKETEKANNVRILTYRADKTGTTSGRRGSGPKRNSDAAVAKSYGMASLQLDVMPLLSGEKSVISRLAENNPKVLDAYVTFTVETPLLSERQKHELNPLIIKINSATCLPNTPVPIEMLQRLCVPTYCKYKFHNFPPHRTHGQVHGTHVYFKDVNVLLTGTMKPGELQSYLRGPPLEIEVHDRDRNMENTTEKPCLFGEDEADEKVEITEINAKALQLDCYPVHLVGMALAALKLKTTLRKVSELDVVTGFHLLDGATHLFVLEGLKDKAIKRLWDRHFERTYRHEDGQLEILYNSQLSFHQRLYTDLEAIFYNFRLCQPLCTITKQSLLYVRGVVPWACFQALSRLSSLCHSKRLRDVIHGDLLPSAEMITVLSHEYGVPLADEDLFTQNPPFLSFSSDDYTVPGKVSRVKQAACSSLDNYKEVHVQRKKEIADKMSFERNHTKANVGAVCQLKGKMKEPKFETFRISPADGKSVFNYSSQSLNSAELAKQHLRQEMAKDPKNRFTYCHEHLSATFDPVDVAAACKEFFAKSKSMWLSPDGFVFPGFKSSLESNRHPQMPDEARLEELSEKWQENVLHANTEPVLSRERWSWDKRHIDFDLYKKPPELFTTPAPQTVCCQPCEDATQILQTRFDDAKLKAHCSTAAGLPTGGPSARFRLQKLQGLLKDEHRKFPLRKAGPVLKAKGNFSRAGRARGHGLFSCPSPGSVGRAPWGFGALLGGRRSVTSSFGPGPDHQHSLRRSRNVAPGTTDSMRRLKKNLQGADFKYDNLTARSSKSEPASFYTVRAKGL